MQRTRNVMLAILALSLTGAIQVRHFVGSLQTVAGTRKSLVLQDDRVVLRPLEPAIGGSRRSPAVAWQISAPYIRSSDGQYLTRREDSHGVHLALSPNRSDDAKWAIEVVEKIAPQHPQRGSRDELRMLIGKAGAHVRLSVFDGPQRGAYWALAPSAESDSPEVCVTVVADARQAVVLEYIEHEFAIDHR